MKKLALLLTALFFTFSFIADAQLRSFWGKGFGPGNPQMFKYPGYQFYQRFKVELSLTNEQLDKMEKIDDSFQKERIDLQSKLEFAQLELQKAIQKDNSKDVILSKQDKVNDLKNQMQKIVLSYKLDLYNILTKEQKTKIDDLRAECRKNFRQGRGKGKGINGPGNGPGNCIGW